MIKKNEIMLISSGYDQQIKFWTDFNNNKCKHVLDLNTLKEIGPVTCLELVPNKEEIAYTVFNTIKFLDLNTLSLVQSSTITNNTASVISNLLFYKNNENLLFTSGEDSHLRLIDRRCGKPTLEFKHDAYVNSIQFGFNNEIIAGDENGEIKVWDINKSQVRTSIKTPISNSGLTNAQCSGELSNAIRSITVSNENKNNGFIISGASNGKLSFFNYKYNQDLNTFMSIDAHKSYITKVLLNSEKNILATCSADLEVKIWSRNIESLLDSSLNSEVDTVSILQNNDLSPEFLFKNKLIGHKKWVWDCCFSIDSAYLVTCSSDKTIKLWSLEEYKQVSNLKNSKGVTKIVICDEDIE